MNVFLKKKKKQTEKLKLVLPGSKENKNYWYRLLVIQCMCLYRSLAALTTFGTSEGSLLVTSGCNWVLPAHGSIQRQTRGNEKYFQDSKRSDWGNKRYFTFLLQNNYPFQGSFTEEQKPKNIMNAAQVEWKSIFCQAKLATVLIQHL